MNPLVPPPATHPLLALEEFGLSTVDLDRCIQGSPFHGLHRATLRETVQALHETYCGTLGIELLDIVDKEQRDWLLQHMEPSRNRPPLSVEDRHRLLEQLLAAEELEQFLQRRYPGQKRFSVEGGESLIVLLMAIVDHAGRLGAEELVLGMPHRGRLNVLAHVLGKPYETLLAEFEGAELPPDVQGDGDVKYHLGYSRDLTTPAGHALHLSLSSNPSHLEWIDPVVQGLARAKQSQRGDTERRRVIPLLLHGDAAFTGQGVVYETMALSLLPGYTNGGTIHVIINNQIGFTTSPSEYQVDPYPSGIGRYARCPILRVNGDDPEACVQAASLAVGYRQAFRKDVLIDFVCYRRRGHNELDDPSLTQPLMYKKIADHPSAPVQYARRLEESGVVRSNEVEERRRAIRGRLDTALTYAREFMPTQRIQAFEGLWKGLGIGTVDDWEADTHVDEARLRSIAEHACRFPEGFTPPPRVQQHYRARLEMVERGEAIDWSTAEMLALGSVLLEGSPVRLTGQDTARGTFSQRHAVVHDTHTGGTFVPLSSLSPEQAPIEVLNSPLNEGATLGFEYGMSSSDPGRLVIWEAQYGDFVSGAQVVIDELIAAGETKWRRSNGLVMLLPHGLEGQGPDHSSARPERFLQLCANGNVQVVNASTPAQYFHVLRRQMVRRFRKPLVLLTPKSLLRHRGAVSPLRDLCSGGFRPVIDDPGGDAAAKKILLCSGRVFYTLMEAGPERPRVAIVRVEQLHPFPGEELARVLKKYHAASELVWVQEEPANGGGWPTAKNDLGGLLNGKLRLSYAGRPASAVPGTAIYRLHVEQERTFVQEALR